MRDVPDIVQDRENHRSYSEHANHLLASHPFVRNCFVRDLDLSDLSVC